MPLQRVGAQTETADQHAGDEKERVRFCVRESKFDGKQNHKRDSEENAVVPGEADRAIRRAGSHIDGDRSDHADSVKTRQCGEASREKKDDRWQSNGDEQRIDWNTITI